MKKQILVFVFLILVLMSTVLIAQQRGPQVPPATGAMLDIANKLAEAVNKQDAAALQKMVAPDAVYLDEDGHAPPIMAWITRITMGTRAPLS